MTQETLAKSAEDCVPSASCDVISSGQLVITSMDSTVSSGAGPPILTSSSPLQQGGGVISSSGHVIGLDQDEMIHDSLASLQMLCRRRAPLYHDPKVRRRVFLIDLPVKYFELFSYNWRAPPSLSELTPY